MSYTVKDLDPDTGRDALIPLWTGNLSDSQIASQSIQRYDWLYSGNPAGPAHTTLGVHVESGETIGCGSIIPRRVVLGGDGSAGHERRTIDAGMLCDFAVHKEHRTAGPAISIQRALAKRSVVDGVAFLFGCPNQKSIAIFKRLRWIFVGKVAAWVKPLRSEYKVRERIKIAPLAKVGGFVVDAALRASSLRRFLRHPSLYKTEILDRADHRFDALWKRVPSSLITGEKTAAFLNWRYADMPTVDYKFFALQRRGELVGFVVYVVRDGVVEVGDLYCDLGDRTVENCGDFDLLIFAFTESMRRQKHRSVYLGYMGIPAIGKILKLHKFFQRPHDPTLLAYTHKGASPELRERITTPDNWLLFDGELDI